MAESLEYDPKTGHFYDPELERVRRAISDLISPTCGDFRDGYEGASSQDLTLMVWEAIYG